MLATMIATALLALAPVPQEAPPPARPAPVLADGSHDFDFEFGAWDAQIRRRLRPLTGSNEWVEYRGSSVVRKVWDGRANLGELDVSGSAGRILGSSYRLYDPAAHEWRIHWASSNDGQLGPAMIGSFAGGRGEFYDAETLGGRAIYVRFIFTNVSAGTSSFRIEQAFSADGGKSWETNWISDFKKRP